MLLYCPPDNVGQGKYSHLECHGPCSDHHPTQHRLALEQTRKTSSFKFNVAPCVLSLEMGKVQFLSSLIKKTLGLDLQKLKLNQRIVPGKTTEIGQDVDGLFLAVVMCEPTGRERHKNHPHSENEGWGQLQSQRKKPGCVALSIARATDIVGTVIDPKEVSSISVNGSQICLPEGNLYVAYMFRSAVNDSARPGNPP